MIKKISEKRLAKGEKLCWNSTIKAKTYELKRTPIKKTSEKSRNLWEDCKKRVFALHGKKCFLCGRETNLDCHHVLSRTGEASKYKYNERYIIPLCNKNSGCKAHNHNGKDNKFFNLLSLIKEKIKLLNYNNLDI